MDSLTRTEQLERDVWALESQVRVMVRAYTAFGPDGQFIRKESSMDSRMDIRDAARALLELIGDE